MSCLYFINNLNEIEKNGSVDGYELVSLDGFVMHSKKSSFTIHNQVIRDVKIVNKDLAYPLVSRMVLQKYQKLLAILTELLISDDESGEAFREALNRIEKFRLEIKNKYRSYLKQKELEMMSKQLTALKQEAKLRLVELNDSYMAGKSSGKSR